MKKGQEYIEQCRNIILENIDRNEFAVFIFGSRAYESHPVKSDIDIGILGSRAFHSKEKQVLKEKIEESNIPYKVDIIDFYGAARTFRKAALQKFKLWSKPKHINIS